jgi:CxxC motif-containing protein (DUF1111 family)
MRVKRLSIAILTAIAVFGMWSSALARFPNLWYFTQAQDAASTPGKLILTYNPDLTETPSNGPYLTGADVSWINNTRGRHCTTVAMTHVSANHFTWAVDALPGDTIDYFFTQRWMGQAQSFYGWIPTHQCHLQTDTKWFTYIMGTGFEKKPTWPLIVNGSERYRNRHEDEWRFDHFAGNYFQNTALNYTLVDWGDSLLVILFPSEPTNWSNGRFSGMSGYEILCDHDVYGDNRGSGDNGPPGGVFDKPTNMPVLGLTANPFQQWWVGTGYNLKWYVWMLRGLAYGQYMDYELSAARTLSDGQLYYSEPQRYYIGLGMISHKFQHPWANAAGEATVNTVTFPEHAFAQHVQTTYAGNSSLFMKGKAVFDTDWKTGMVYNYATPFDCNGSPMSFPDTTHSPFYKANIVGPFFTQTACFVCHFQDGKGYPENMFGTDPNFKTIAFVGLQMPDGKDHPVFGPSLNNKAIPPYQPEGNLNITWETIDGKYADGTSFQLRKPKYSFSNLGYGVTSIDLNQVRISPRFTPHLSGMGFLEAIDENTILSFVNMAAKTGTGIAGKPQRVNDKIHGNNALGRFGWKAVQPSIKSELYACVAADLGISNKYYGDQGPAGFTSNPPEISDAVMDTLISYISLLVPPPREMGKGYIVYDPKIKNATSGGAIWADKTLYKGEAFEKIWLDPSAIRGKDLFVRAKCDLCHIPAIRTGTFSKFQELNNIEVQPFTDLLLHDMGPEDGDNGYVEGSAGPNDWRTAPLWGMWYIQYVNQHTLFMHDGRARNLEEAILWHFGEGTVSRNAFINMNAQERADLVRYTQYPFWDRLPKLAKTVIPTIARQAPVIMKAGLPALTCFPNPVHNVAMFRLENIACVKGDRVTVSIYNLQGQRVFYQMVRPGQNLVAWNTVHYGTGKYVAQLSANGKIYKKSLLVVR